MAMAGGSDTGVSVGLCGMVRVGYNIHEYMFVVSVFVLLHEHCAILALWLVRW
jgi:hypothetical protein